MYIHTRHASSRHHGRGFSLVELLIVIAVISILMTVGAIGINGVTAGKSMSTAVATTETYFDEARSIAITNHTRSRVLVDVNDPKNADTYLRRLVIVYEKTDAEGKIMPEQWVLLNRGLKMPESIYFSRDYSVKDMENSASPLDEQNLSGADIKTAYEGKYVYYEFNSEGICSSPGASFVIGTGARPAGAEKPRVTASAKRDFGGFVIWRNGRTSMIKTPDQIGLTDNLTTF